MTVPKRTKRAKPEDLIGENGLLKQLNREFVEHCSTPAQRYSPSALKLDRALP